MIIYNAEAVKADIIVYLDDTFNPAFDVGVNGVDEELTGMTIVMEVFQRRIADPIKTLTSAGENPGITISGNSFAFDPSQFSTPERYTYRIYLIDGTRRYTFMYGNLIIKNTKKG